LAPGECPRHLRRLEVGRNDRGWASHEEEAMKAQVGDRLVVRGRHVGDGERSGEILEVRGDKGEPPYRVRWDDGVVDLIIPSSDATVRPAGAG